MQQQALPHPWCRVGWVSLPGRTHRVHTGLRAVAVQLRALGSQAVRRLAHVAGAAFGVAASFATAAAARSAMPILLLVAAAWLRVLLLPGPVPEGPAAAAALVTALAYTACGQPAFGALLSSACAWCGRRCFCFMAAVR